MDVFAVPLSLKPPKRGNWRCDEAERGQRGPRGDEEGRVGVDSLGREGGQLDARVGEGRSPFGGRIARQNEGEQGQRGGGGIRWMGRGEQVRETEVDVLERAGGMGRSEGKRGSERGVRGGTVQAVQRGIAAGLGVRRERRGYRDIGERSRHPGEKPFEVRSVR